MEGSPLTTKTIAAHIIGSAGVDEERAVTAVVRVRPFTEKEQKGPLPPPSTLRRLGNSELVADAALCAADTRVQRDLHFMFDRVVWSVPPMKRSDPEEEGQEVMFEVVGAPTVAAALRGYNVCVFAYGQTGSGKSHTIFGPPHDPGLIPHLASALFHTLQAKAMNSPGHSFTYTVEIACFEIYNEKVSDLFLAAQRMRHRRTATTDSSASRHESPLASPTYLSEPDNSDEDTEPKTTLVDDSEDNKHQQHLNFAATARVVTSIVSWTADVLRNHRVSELKVRFHPDTGPYIPGLRREFVEDAEELTYRISQAIAHRVTAATLMNETSSRSHCVVQIVVQQEDKIEGIKSTSLLNVVDLAGSERITRSGSHGAALAEAKSINLSLTTLRRVIDIIIENNEKEGKKKKYIHQVPPVRESTLTWLLSDSFGGNSLTWMIATVSPHEDNAQDTLSTLRYATKARSIVCHVRVNRQRVAVAVHAILDEVDRLRSAISEFSLPSGSPVKRLKAIEEQIDHVEKAKRIVRKTAQCREEHRKKAEEVTKETEHKLGETNKVVASLRRVHAQIIEINDELAQVAADTEMKRYRSRELQNRMWELQQEIDSASMELDYWTQVPLPQSVKEYLSLRRSMWRRQFVLAAVDYKQRTEGKKILREVARFKEEQVALCDKIQRTRYKADIVASEVDRQREVFRASEIRVASLGGQFQKAYEEIHRCQKISDEAEEARKNEVRALKDMIEKMEEFQFEVEEDRAEALMKKGSIEKKISKLADEEMQLDHDIHRFLQELAEIEVATSSFVDSHPERVATFSAANKESDRLVEELEPTQAAGMATERDLMDVLYHVAELDREIASLAEGVKDQQYVAFKFERTLEGVETAAGTKTFPDAPRPRSREEVRNLANYALALQPSRTGHITPKCRSMSPVVRPPLHPLSRSSSPMPSASRWRL